MRAAERESHLGENHHESDVALKVMTTWGAGNQQLHSRFIKRKDVASMVFFMGNELLRSMQSH